mgnify:CR=1 FL=1
MEVLAILFSTLITLTILLIINLAIYKKLIKNKKLFDYQRVAGTHFNASTGGSHACKPHVCSPE